MGIDAQILVRYRGDKPTDQQLATWSFNLCTSIGADKFLIEDGLKPAEFREAEAKWNDTFQSHPWHERYKAIPYPNWNDPQSEKLHAERMRIGDIIRAATVGAVGEYPTQLWRAIELTGVRYPKDGEAPGKVYHQDGDSILADEGEWFLEVSLWSRYYGIGYERGDILTICAIAEWLEMNLQPCEVWYGGDSSGVEATPFTESARRDMRRHLYGPKGRDYFDRSGQNEKHIKPPNPCGLCIPGKPRFSQNGWGREGQWAVFGCSGCAKSFVTEDAGQTFKVRKED